MANQLGLRLPRSQSLPEGHTEYITLYPKGGLLVSRVGQRP